MLNDETQKKYERAMKILTEYLVDHPLRKTVIDIIGTNTFVLEETLRGYAMNTIIELPHLLRNTQETNFDKIMEICKKRLDKYNEELLRPSENDIVITYEDIKRDQSEAEVDPESFTIFKLTLHYINKYGISKFFRYKYSDPKELREKVTDFIADYFEYMISQSPEDSRKGHLLNIYGVVILRDNLKMLLIDMED